MCPCSVSFLLLGRGGLNNEDGLDEQEDTSGLQELVPVSIWKFETQTKRTGWKLKKITSCSKMAACDRQS